MEMIRIVMGKMKLTAISDLLTVFFLQDHRSHPCHLAHTSRRQLPSSVGAFSKGMVGLLDIL